MSAFKRIREKTRKWHFITDWCYLNSFCFVWTGERSSFSTHVMSVQGMTTSLSIKQKKKKQMIKSFINEDLQTKQNKIWLFEILRHHTLTSLFRVVSTILLLPEQITKKCFSSISKRVFKNILLKTMEGRSHRALAPIASHGSAELLSDNNYFMEAEEGDEVRKCLYNNNNNSLKYSQTCVQRPLLGPKNSGRCWQVVVVQRSFVL